MHPEPVCGIIHIRYRADLPVRLRQVLPAMGRYAPVCFCIEWAVTRRSVLRRCYPAGRMGNLSRGMIKTNASVE